MLGTDFCGNVVDIIPVGKPDLRDVDVPTLRRLLLAVLYERGLPVEKIGETFGKSRWTVQREMRRVPSDAGSRLLDLLN